MTLPGQTNKHPGIQTNIWKYGLSGITHCVLQDVGYQSCRLSLTLGDGPITPAVYEDIGILSTQQYQPFPEFFFQSKGCPFVYHPKELSVCQYVSVSFRRAESSIFYI